MSFGLPCANALAHIFFVDLFSAQQVICVRLTYVEHYCNDNVGFYLQGKRTISIAKFTLTRV